MPSKNAIKTYVENGYYHVYNRGVEKRTIFQDREDYSKFLYFIKIYLTPLEELSKEFPLLRSNLVKNNLSGEVELLALCLMPNHFHLLIKQNTKVGMTKFLRQLNTSYSMYFNKRHERVGPLFQGRFKAANVETDEYLLHLSRYIHLNPLARGASLDEFDWSSYLYYLGKKEPVSWLNTNFISEYFNNSKRGFSYKDFVEDYVDSTPLDSYLTIDSEA